MDWRALPPLSGLRAFAAFVDTGSVQKAGDALNVSHAAISQQLRVLEAHLGIPLLRKDGRSLVPTSEGAELSRALLNGFGEIASTVAQLTGAETARPLHVSATPSFAANWLMPRLANFRSRHPDINVMIDPNPAITDPAPGGIDLALRYGAGEWPGLECECLMVSPIVVVAAPSLIGNHKVQTPGDLLNFPWLQELGTNEASKWLADVGVADERPKSLTHVPGNLMLDGARSGQGVAVTAMVSVEEDLRSGRLNVLFEAKGDAGYHIVTPRGVLRPQTRHFIAWLRREAGKTGK